MVLEVDDSNCGSGEYRHREIGAGQTRERRTRNWISVKQGERRTGLTFTLAEGAGSLRGSVKLAERERIPAQLDLYLIPAEKEYAEDVLRYFATAVNPDGTFAQNTYVC